MVKIVKGIILTLMLLLIYAIGVMVGILYEKANEPDYCDTGTMCIKKVEK